MSRDCPSGGRGGGGYGGGRAGCGRGGGACYNCGQEGHMFRDCPASAPQRGGRGGGGRGGGACYNCGQEGHMSRDCPGNAKSMSYHCIKCGEVGIDVRHTKCPTCGVPRAIGCGARTTTAQSYDYVVVLDFEATCDLEKTIGRTVQQEIIEWPSVLIDCSTMMVVSEFQRYVKPIKIPKLLPFCTELTGITQSTVDVASTFKTVQEEYVAWLQSGGMGTGRKSFVVVTCGDWDLKTMLPSQSEFSKTKIPGGLHQWCNVKQMFEATLGGSAGGMAHMLQTLGIVLEGHHHSGIDDCRNIAKIVLHMMQAGYDVRCTSRGCFETLFHGEEAMAPPVSSVVKKD